MPLDAVPRYGRCTCGGTYSASVVQVNLPGAEGLELLKQVPVGSCQRCGSRVYDPSVIVTLELLMRGAMDRGPASRFARPA